jgi:glycosyltransferase involved in cell wall biosynthesis
MLATMVSLVIGWGIALGVLMTLLDVLIGGRRITRLATVAPLGTGPSVSIVVAARNEADGIEQGVRSLLALDYSPLEVVVVNDRSTDGTGTVLERVRREHPRLTVVTVDALPAGWLGKNHALALGAARATGEVLLFTDADVVFAPSVVGRAVRVLEERRLDHLTALPGVESRGIALTTLVATFGVLFSVYSRPWEASNPRSKRHIGVGAFNLLRASAYHRVGTHAAIALRPDDDMRLARIVKAAGLRADVVHARGLLSVEWYTSVGQMIDGLMKNAFAGINYSVRLLVLSTLALLIFNVWPWMALLVTEGAVRVAAGVTVGALCLIMLLHTQTIQASPLIVPLYPLGVLGFVYIMWRSAWLALSRGVITWRDTAYPLADLKRAAPARPLLGRDAGAPGTS